MTTYMDVNAAENAAVAADTEEICLDTTIPVDKGGVITKILVSYAGVVNAKAANGFVELKLGSHNGPFRYPVGGGNGGATNASPNMNAEKIFVNIPVMGSETVKGYLTLVEAAVNAHVGIQWTAK